MDPGGSRRHPGGFAERDLICADRRGRPGFCRSGWTAGIPGCRSAVLPVLIARRTPDMVCLKRKDREQNTEDMPGNKTGGQLMTDGKA